MGQNFQKRIKKVVVEALYTYVLLSTHLAHTYILHVGIEIKKCLGEVAAVFEQGVVLE